MLYLTKQILALIGGYLPTWAVYQLRAGWNYLAIGRWMSDRGFRFPKQVGNRRQVWTEILKSVRCDQVLYLEFGVFKGAATEFWSRELKNPDSILHGFDSFEGLPEAGGPWEKGRFDLGEQIPLISDPRVKFFKGWFDQVLPNHSMPKHETLVLNMDADLYSSTIFVLRHLRPFIRPGTFIYFDEMNHIDHEPRAFQEFMEESGLEFSPVCADRTFAFVAFKCVDGDAKA